MDSAKPREEPWLRGTRTEVKPLARAVLHALDLTREDAGKWSATLDDREFSASPFGLPSPAVQLRHIVGTLDRFMTYAECGSLSPEQLTYLKHERELKSREEVLEEFSRGLDSTERWLLAHQEIPLDAPVKVGRKGLPTTAAGILVHMAEHTERHIGQFVTTAKLLAAMRTTDKPHDFID